MGYMLYSGVFFFFIVFTCLYLTRTRWTSSLPPIPYVTVPGRIPGPLYTLIPSSFQADMESGLTSTNFDLSENVEAGDSRRGLDGAAKAQVRNIMTRRGVDFDEARRIYIQERFRDNAIDERGRPMDPKAVMFDR